MKTVEEHLKEAIYYENRGYIDYAKKHYDLIKGHEHLLSKEALTRISQFYFSLNEFDVTLKASRLAIEQTGDIYVLAPLFILSWEQTNGDVKNLEWLLLQPGMDYLIHEKLVIANHLFVAGKSDKAYIVSLEIADKMDRLFRDQPSQYSLYVDSVLNLVEMEFMFKNFTQARFHLRKLIYLESERMIRIPDIAYWSALLDEMSTLVTRPDWSVLEDSLTGDIKLISLFYSELSISKLRKQTIKLIEESVFEDELLNLKRTSYLRLVSKMRGQEYWYEGIVEDFSKLPDDLLTTLLYAEFLKTTRPHELKPFWEIQFPKHADRAEAIKAYWKAFKKDDVTGNIHNLEDCQVTFFGGGEKIGGTSILISIRGKHLLLDAGMHLHEETYYPDYSSMLEIGITFEDIDALLISHAHMDHTGAVPYVRKKRKNMPIYATEATRDLMKLLLSDSARIGQKENQEMYSEQDVQEAFLSIKSVEFNQTFSIPSMNSVWNITYYPSGHILGAGSIHIEMDGINVFFTGDYSVDDQKTVQGLVLPSDIKVDYLITESTYGFLPTNASMDRTRQETLFVESVKRTMDKNGTMLIPAFAVGRAQEIILLLKDAFKQEKYLPFNLFLDGRVTDVCRIYQRFAEQKRYINPYYYQDEKTEQYLFGGGVQAAQEIYTNKRGSDFTFNDFMEDYIFPGNNCVLASSGMLTNNSASARYAEHLIEDDSNSISFTGYMDEESPGSHVLQNAKYILDEKVNINGKEKKVQARIESFRLSAHASREQILQLVVNLQPQKVFLMHGEHTKRYSSTQTIVGGEVIYPSLIDLLKNLNDKIEVIPAFNGKSYKF